MAILHPYPRWEKINLAAMVLRLRTTHDHTAQALKRVFLVIVENRDLDLLAPLLPTDLYRDREIRLHVLTREAIFVEERPSDALPDPFLW